MRCHLPGQRMAAILYLAKKNLMKYFLGLFFSFFFLNAFSQQKDTVIKIKDLDIFRGSEQIGFIDETVDSSGSSKKITRVIFYSLSGDIIGEASIVTTKGAPHNWSILTPRDNKRHSVKATKGKEKEELLAVLVKGKYFEEEK